MAENELSETRVAEILVQIRQERTRAMYARIAATVCVLIILVAFASRTYDRVKDFDVDSFFTHLQVEGAKRVWPVVADELDRVATAAAPALTDAFSKEMMELSPRLQTALATESEVLVANLQERLAASLDEALTKKDVVGSSGIAERFPRFQNDAEAMQELNEQLLRATREWANVQLDTTFHDHFRILDSINETFFALEGEARDDLEEGATPANLEDVLTLFLEIIDTRLNVEEYERRTEMTTNNAGIEGLLLQELQKEQKATRLSYIVSAVLVIFVLLYTAWLGSRITLLLDPEGLALSASGLVLEATPDVGADLEATLVDGAPELARSVSQSIVDAIPTFRVYVEEQLGPVIDTTAEEMAAAAVAKLSERVANHEMVEGQETAELANAIVEEFEAGLDMALDEPDEEGETPRQRIEASLESLEKIDRELKIIARGRSLSGTQQQERDLLMAWLQMIVSTETSMPSPAAEEAAPIDPAAEPAEQPMSEEDQAQD